MKYVNIEIREVKIQDARIKKPLILSYLNIKRNLTSVSLFFSSKRQSHIITKVIFKL